MGVAVSTSTSTASPFCVEREPLVHAEAVLLVDDGERQIVKRDVFLKQRVGADQEIDIAERKTIEDLLTPGAALAAGQNGDADAGGFRQRRDRGEMLARENFRRRHERSLAAGLDHGCGRSERDDGFSRADIALQQTQHSLRASKIGDDVVNRLLLRMGQCVRQRLEDARPQAPLAGAAAARLAGAYGRAPGRARVGPPATRHRRGASMRGSPA